MFVYPADIRLYSEVKCLELAPDLVSHHRVSTTMGTLELHIYGPALDLPSIDVRCLAAIALLQSCLDSENKSWKLIPSSDPNLNPFNELPALKDGNLWVAGFRNIGKYIESRRSLLPINSEFDFDLDTQRRADSEAYLSFLESRGLPLLDLSLYVSSDNYTTCTRSALSDVFSWPRSWTIPQRLRDEARKRSEHLGLSGLDVDATREKELKEESEGLSAQIPKALRRPKQSVTSLLGSTAEQTRFRLEAVTAACFEPLEELLGEKKYFLGNRITILDCYASAILTQMQISVLPQPWLQEALDNKHPRLSEWARKSTHDLYEHEILPWTAVAEGTWLETASGVLNFMAESIPITLVPTVIRSRDEASIPSKTTRNGERKQSNHKRDGVSICERKQLFRIQARRYQNTIREIIAATVSSAGLAGALVYMGMLSMPSFRKSQPLRRDFGAAGALLGLG